MALRMHRGQAALGPALCLAIWAGAAGCAFDPQPGLGLAPDALPAQDAAAPVDAADGVDVGPPVDAGQVDAGHADATPRDAEPTDGPPDPSDSGVDAGPSDTGVPCGNGQLDLNEQCDDNNRNDGDGCTSDCQIQPGWDCEGEPSECYNLPLFSIDDTRTVEGDPARFIVQLSWPAPFEVTFEWSTRDGSATTPADYLEVDREAVTMARGARTATLTVDTLSDGLLEGDETFGVQAFAVVGARPTDPNADVVVEDISVLTDRGLVARYFLDDVPPNQPLPGALADAAPNPLALTVVQDISGEPVAVERATGRGLGWTRSGRFGRVGVGTDGTKVRARMDGSLTGTIEVVALVLGTANASRLLHLGERERGQFSLLISSSIYLAHGGDDLYGWPRPAGVLGRRAVFTVVYDTSQGSPANRLRLYIDGADQGPPDFAIDRNTTIDVAQGNSLLIGNRTGGGYSIDGEIFYGALYDSALDAAEVAQNAGLLLNRDDP